MGHVWPSGRQLEIFIYCQRLLAWRRAEGPEWANGGPRPLGQWEQTADLALMSPKAALAPWGPDPAAPQRGLREIARTHQAGPEPRATAVGGGPLGTPALPQAPLPECLQGEVGDVLPPSEVGLVAGGSASLGSPGGKGASI